MTDSSEAATTQTVARPKRPWLWPVIIIGLIAAHTLGMLIMAFISTSDPSQAVVSDYHAKALAWDQHEAVLRASAELGWTCTIVTALDADMLGQRNVRISLRDANGEPLTGAQVSLDAYHHARGSDIISAVLEEGAPGEYVVMAKLRRPGMWTFTINAKRGEDAFVTQIDQQVGPGPWSKP